MQPAGLSRTMLYGDSLPPDSLARGYTGNSENDFKLEEPLRLERPDSYVGENTQLGREE